MEKKAVLFDCWNTLFKNTEDPLERIADEVGCSPDDREFLKIFEENLMEEKLEGEELRGALGDFLEQLCSEPPKAEQVERLADILEETVRTIEPFPEALEVLEDLGKEYRLGLVTNTYYISQKELQSRFDLEEFFDETFFSCEEGMIKPDPEVFEKILERMDIEKKDALMVGDSLEDDVRAAQDFGIEAVLVDHEESGKYPENTRVVDSLDDLRDIL